MVILLAMLGGCASTSISDSAAPIVTTTYAEANDPALLQQGGILWHHQHPYTGIVFALHPNGDTLSSTTYQHGKQQGQSSQWYHNGTKASQRYYVQNRKTGLHRGWWPNGQKKFEYFFANDVHEGVAKEWYPTGELFRKFNYTNGHEEGLQQAWERDGRIRTNYVAKNGRKYGLSGIKSCINVWNEIEN